MKKGLIFSRVVWSVLCLVGLLGFSTHLDSIAWLMVFLSATLPLLLSIASSNKAWDRSFLSILVVSLQIVAIAVSWAQWLVLDASPLHLVGIPALSLLFWIYHERIVRAKAS